MPTAVLGGGCATASLSMRPWEVEVWTIAGLVTASVIVELWRTWADRSEAGHAPMAIVVDIRGAALTAVPEDLEHLQDAALAPRGIPVATIASLENIDGAMSLVRTACGHGFVRGAFTGFSAGLSWAQTLGWAMELDRSSRAAGASRSGRRAASLRTGDGAPPGRT